MVRPTGMGIAAGLADVLKTGVPGLLNRESERRDARAAEEKRRRNASLAIQFLNALDEGDETTTPATAAATSTPSFGTAAPMPGTGLGVSAGLSSAPSPAPGTTPAAPSGSTQQSRLAALLSQIDDPALQMTLAQTMSRTRRDERTATATRVETTEKRRLTEEYVRTKNWGGLRGLGVDPIPYIREEREAATAGAKTDADRRKNAQIDEFIQIATANPSDPRLNPLSLQIWQKPYGDPALARQLTESQITRNLRERPQIAPEDAQRRNAIRLFQEKVAVGMPTYDVHGGLTSRRRFTDKEIDDLLAQLVLSRQDVNLPAVPPPPPPPPPPPTGMQGRFVSDADPAAANWSRGGALQPTVTSGLSAPQTPVAAPALTAERQNALNQPAAAAQRPGLSPNANELLNTLVARKAREPNFAIAPTLAAMRASAANNPAMLAEIESVERAVGIIAPVVTPSPSAPVVPRTPPASSAITPASADSRDIAPTNIAAGNQRPAFDPNAGASIVADYLRRQRADEAVRSMDATPLREGSDSMPPPAQRNEQPASLPAMPSRPKLTPEGVLRPIPETPTPAPDTAGYGATFAELERRYRTQTAALIVDSTQAARSASFQQTRGEIAIARLRTKYRNDTGRYVEHLRYIVASPATPSDIKADAERELTNVAGR